MSEDNITIMLEIKDQRVKDDLDEAVSSLKGFEVCRDPLKVQNPENHEHYDLLIMEIGDMPKREFQFVKTLQASGITKDVFLTSSNTKPDFLMEAFGVGAKGFFPQPINKEVVKTALLKIKEQKENEKAAKESANKGMIIDVFGSKGGVGTTTVAVNLAVSLAKLAGDKKVALIDMNIPFGEITLHLDIKPNFDWAEVIKNLSRLDSTYLGGTITKHPSGIYVLSSPSKVVEKNAIKVEDLETLLRLMQTMFDFIVIDSGQSFNDLFRGIMKISDKVIIVSELNLPCIINLKRTKNIFRELGYPGEENTEIIVNRFYKNSEISIKEIEKDLNKKFLCCIPDAYNIFMSTINQGKPLCAQSQEKRKGIEVSKIFERLAFTFSGQSVEEKKKRIFSMRSIFS
ncbi:MAG: AAA family ATPase [Candidatus Scalinduaceae bacterium]